MRLKKIGDHLVQLFEMPPGERSAEELRALLPIIMMKTTCLKDLPPETVSSILQKATLLRCGAETVVVKQGDPGDTFYIILRGTVSVYLDPKQEERLKTADDMFPPPPPTRQGTNLSQRSHRSRPELDDEDIIKAPSAGRSRRESMIEVKSSRSKRRQSLADKRDEKKHRRKLGICVNNLGRYQTFGELALVYPASKRNASVITDEATDMLAISAENFSTTLKDILERDLEEKRIFIQTHPFFSKWPLPLQRQLQWSLQRGVHRLGDHVIRQGDTITGMYFLVSGRARLTAEPLKHRIQFPELFIKPKFDPFAKHEPPRIERETTTLSELADSVRLSKSRKNLLAGMDPLTYIRRADGYAAAEKVVFEKTVDLCVIEEGEVVCDSELLLGLDKNVFGITCSTVCIFYHLDIKIFDRLIFKKTPQTLSMMKVLAEQKLSRRISSAQGQKVPILSPLLLRILDVRVVDPLADGKEKDEWMDPLVNAIRLTKPEGSARPPTVPEFKRAKTVLIDWFVQGKTPLLQPITKDAIYYREMIQKRAKFREVTRLRGPKELQEVKSLGRRVKDSYWANLREGMRARNTMKRLKLQNSELTPAARWK